MSKEDIKKLGIDVLLEERRRTLKEGDKVRLIVRNKNLNAFSFNKFGNSEAGEFRADPNALDVLELKEGDKIEAWLNEVYYDDGKVYRELAIKVKEIIL